MSCLLVQWAIRAWLAVSGFSMRGAEGVSAEVS